MQVNTSKTKVVIFSSKRKHNQHKFYFEGNTLEEVADYKYLEIDFNKNLIREGCRKKRNLGGWKAFYAFQNRRREAELWDWKTMQTLFGLLVISVVLYGCEVWGNNVDLCTLGGVPHVLSLLSTCGKVIWHFVLCPLCLFCT
jgi:hypothetical protein